MGLYIEAEKVNSLINEAKQVKYCLLSGANEIGYEHIQNIEDELTTILLEEIKRQKEKASTQPPQNAETNSNESGGKILSFQNYHTTKEE